MTKEFITLKLDELVPYENNPRINDGAVHDVVQSIKDCNNLDPIEIDENNVILSGHTRLMALQQLGYEETECIRYTGLTEEQKKKYRILANKTNELAEWNNAVLELELEDLDFSEYDFDFEVDLDTDEPTEVIEDEAPEPPEEPICKLGDIWQLGKHRLMCGDSTDINDVQRLMGGNLLTC